MSLSISEGLTLGSSNDQIGFELREFDLTPVSVL